MCICYVKGKDGLEGPDKRHILLKRIHCFCYCSIDNQIEESDKNIRNDILKQTLKNLTMENERPSSEQF